MSAGVAAGIAAAFGAPIGESPAVLSHRAVLACGPNSHRHSCSPGGVLFSMEEASTFWSRRVAWRSFVCAVAAAFTISQVWSAGAYLPPSLLHVREKKIVAEISAPSPCS